MYIIILIIVIIHKKERKNKTFNIYYNIPTYKHDKNNITLVDTTTTAWTSLVKEVVVEIQSFSSFSSFSFLLFNLDTK